MSKITTLNVGGVLSPVTQTSFLKYIQECEIDISMVQETNQRNGVNLDVLAQSNRYDLFTSLGSRRGSGVLFMVSNTLCINDVTFSDIYAGYSAALIFKNNLTKYTIINIYLPHDQEVANDILSATKHFLMNMNAGCVVVGGDYNCVLNPGLDRSSGVETHNAIAKALSSFVAFFTLSDPFRVFFPSTLSYTRIVNNRNGFCGSQIGRFYISETSINTISNIEHNVCPFSDHHYVHLTLDEMKRKTAYWIFDCNLLRSDRFNEYVINFWQEWRSEKERYEDIGQWWDIGKIHLRSNIQCSFPKRRTGNGIFDRLIQLEKQVANNPLLINQFVELKDKVKLIMEQSSLEQMAQAKSKKLKYGNTPTKYFFRNLKRRSKLTEIEAIRSNDGHIITGNATHELIRQHISNQFQTPIVSNPDDSSFFMAFQNFRGQMLMIWTLT